MCDDVIALTANDKCKTVSFSLNVLRTAAQLDKNQVTYVYGAIQSHDSMSNYWLCNESAGTLLSE